MNEATKTICFVVAAGAMLTAAIASNIANQPRPVADFETIGQAFFPDFEKTNLAKSLVVNAIDPVTVKGQTFEIKQEDGLWQIPSHEGYPAEAAERLARTSASLMGLTRDSLVGRRVSDHAKFGVIDPRAEDIVDVDAVGQSITLKDANEDTLVDFVIGKQANKEDESTRPGQLPTSDDEPYYYVRRADESNVYRIPLNIELSTKFSDWIEPDLLQIDGSNVTALKLNNYEIEERSGGLFSQTKTLVKKPGDLNVLSRKSSTDDWTLEGLDPKTETVQASAVDEIVALLDEMQIVDVDRKPTLDGKMLLDADLNYSVTPEQAKLLSVRTQADLDRLSPAEQQEFQRLQVAVAELQQDLQSHGFNFGSTGEKLELVSAGGEAQIGTADGLLYTLHVGKAKSDAKNEIKLTGSTEEASNDDASSTETETVDDKQTEEPNKDAQSDNSANSKSDDEQSSEEDADAADGNRYVLIRVGFEESLLGDDLQPPTEPVEPIKPEGYVPVSPKKIEGVSADEGQQNSDDPKDAADEESDDAPAPKSDNPEDADEEKADDQQENDRPRDPKFVAYDEALAAYNEAKIDFEVATSEYQTQLEQRAEEIKEGKQKADVLNQRFEKWYYVVAGDNLATLQAKRATLVSKKDPPAVSVDDLGQMPDTSFPQIDLPKETTSDAVSPNADAPSKETPALNAVEKPAAKPVEEINGAENEISDSAPEASNSVDEPVTDESSPKEPVIDEPVIDEPVIDEPVIDEPAIDETVQDDASNEATSESAMKSELPMDSDAVDSETVVADPNATESATENLDGEEAPQKTDTP